MGQWEIAGDGWRWSPAATHVSAGWQMTRVAGKDTMIKDAPNTIVEPPRAGIS